MTPTHRFVDTVRRAKHLAFVGTKHLRRRTTGLTDGRRAAAAALRPFAFRIDRYRDPRGFFPFDFFLEPQAEAFPFSYEDWQLQELQPYLRQEAPTPRFAGTTGRTR